MPASIRLLAQQTQAPVVRRGGRRPETPVLRRIIGIVRRQAGRSVGGINGKQKAIVDNKLVRGRVPAKDILRAGDGDKDASRNKLHVVRAIGETFACEITWTFESRMPVGATSTRNTLPLPPLTQRIPSASSAMPLPSKTMFGSLPSSIQVRPSHRMEPTPSEWPIKMREGFFGTAEGHRSARPDRAQRAWREQGRRPPPS